VKTIEALRLSMAMRWCCFICCDPKETFPTLRGPAVLVDLETDQRLEVIPDYVKHQYRAKMTGHLAEMREKTQRGGWGISC